MKPVWVVVITDGNTTNVIIEEATDKSELYEKYQFYNGAGMTNIAIAGITMVDQAIREWKEQRKLGVR